MKKTKITSTTLRVLCLSGMICYHVPAAIAESTAITNASSAYTQAAIKALQQLSQAEIDASFLLGQAIDNINNSNLKTELQKIKTQTEEHIKTLASIIHTTGNEAPAYSRDFKGFFMQGYAAMRGALSDQGVIIALHTNLKRILEVYESELNASNLPSDTKTKIRTIYETKRKHLNYLATQF